MKVLSLVFFMVSIGGGLLRMFGRRKKNFVESVGQEKGFILNMLNGESIRVVGMDFRKTFSSDRDRASEEDYWLIDTSQHGEALGSEAISTGGDSEEALMNLVSDRRDVQEFSLHRGAGEILVLKGSSVLSIRGIYKF